MHRILNPTMAERLGCFFDENILAMISGHAMVPQLRRCTRGQERRLALRRTQRMNHLAESLSSLPGDGPGQLGGRGIQGLNSDSNDDMKDKDYRSTCTASVHALASVAFLTASVHW